MEYKDVKVDESESENDQEEQLSDGNQLLKYLSRPVVYRWVMVIAVIIIVLLLAVLFLIWKSERDLIKKYQNVGRAQKEIGNEQEQEEQVKTKKYLDGREVIDERLSDAPIPLPGGDANLLAYLKVPNPRSMEGEIKIVDGDGVISMVHNLGEYRVYESEDVSTQSNILVYYTRDYLGVPGKYKRSLWVARRGKAPRPVFVDEYDGRQGIVDGVAISDDGTLIAYSFLVGYGSGNGSKEQLWLVNVDGTDHRLVIDDTGQFVERPFRLIPARFSPDNKSLFLDTTSDSEASPKGLFVADLATNTITKAKTPDKFLAGLDFSPTDLRVAWIDFTWKDVLNKRPLPEPPYKLNITDLETGTTITIAENDVKPLSLPKWSTDGRKIAYKVGSYDDAVIDILVVDIVTGKTSKVISVDGESNSVSLEGWLSPDILVYIESSRTTGQVLTLVTDYLFTIRADGSAKKNIDSAEKIKVYGAF